MRAVRSIPDTVPAKNRTLGWSILDWSAEYLRQPDGESAGQPWEYTKEQVRIVLRWYAIDDQGRFAYRRGVLRRMKGWGKDPCAGTLAAAELCGPCRFGGFDADGSPVAVPQPAPWIQIAAVSQDQTRNMMGLFVNLFSEAAIDEYRLDIGKTIIYAHGGTGQIESVTNSPRALEGKRSTFVVLDESQHWVAGNDGLTMAKAIRRNSAKAREGGARSLEITNAHQPGEGSVAEETYEGWKAAGGEVPGLYYDSVEAPNIKDLKNQEAVRAGLQLARGDSTWLDLDRLVAEIADPTTPASESRRFYLNQVVAVVGERWIGLPTWDACADLEHDVPDASRIVLALDGSFNNDSTAVVGCLIDERPHLFVVGLWRPEGPEDEVDIADVEEAIRQAAQRWNVVELAADPYRWQRSLQVLRDEGINAVLFPQSAVRMSPATVRFSDMATQKALTQDGNHDLRLHIANAVVITDRRGRRLQKQSKNSPKKIDLAVAGVMALDRAVTLNSETGGDMIHDLTETESYRRWAAGLPFDDETELDDDEEVDEPTESETVPAMQPVPARPLPGKTVFIPLPEMPAQGPWGLR